MPAMMIALFEVHRFAGSLVMPHPEAFDPISYSPAVVDAVASTVAAAAVAAIAGIGSALLFRGHGYIIGLFCCAPILHLLWPWNSVFHDFHWTALHWAMASYEFLIVPLLVLWVTQRTLGFMPSNKTIEPTR
jgi:hypothetical protein